MKGLHERPIDPLSLPRLAELVADTHADFLLDGCVETAVFHEQQHHVRPNLLRSERRHADGHLDQFVEVVGDQEIVVDALEVLPDRMLDHVVVGSDDKGGIL